MNEVIVANSSGEEIRSILYKEYDFEVGDFENSFLVTCNRAEWENIPNGARIYIPGTEYGGIYRRLESDTKNNIVAVGGYTWRGMLQKKVIIPSPGADYATDSGELNAVIGARISSAFPNLFVSSSESTGITVNNYQYDRYVTLYDGLKSMLKSKGYKMQIQYDQERCKVVISAVPIVDYSAQIEYSSDMNADYTMQLDSTGINHLICLGQGELRDRAVIHLYMDNNGTISRTQTLFNENEIAMVYDYAGAAEEDLIKSGIDRLKDSANLNQFSIDLESARDVAIGDIVGSRDYITGMVMTAPVTTKIVTWRSGFEKTEYKLSDDVIVSS